MTLFPMFGLTLTRTVINQFAARAFAIWRFLDGRLGVTAGGTLDTRRTLLYDRLFPEDGGHKDFLAILLTGVRRKVHLLNTFAHITITPSMPFNGISWWYI